MDTNIYVVYDSEQETDESLGNFVSVMEKAGYPLDKIVTLSNIQFNEYIDNKQILPFVLCLNNTFQTYCMKYSDILDVPVFEFFSKEYFNAEKNVYLTGILLNIESIFQAAYKKYAWKILQKFYSVYSDAIKDLVDVAVVAETTEVIVEVQEKVEAPIIEAPIVELKQATEELETKTIETGQTQAVKEVNFDAQDLRDLYLEVKLLVNQFNIIQDRIKSIDQNFNNEKL